MGLYLASIHQMAPPEHTSDKQALRGHAVSARFMTCKLNVIVRAYSQTLHLLLILIPELMLIDRLQRHFKPKCKHLFLCSRPDIINVCHNPCKVLRHLL